MVLSNWGTPMTTETPISPSWLLPMLRLLQGLDQSAPRRSPRWTRQSGTSKSTLSGEKMIKQFNDEQL